VTACRYFGLASEPPDEVGPLRCDRRTFGTTTYVVAALILLTTVLGPTSESASSPVPTHTGSAVTTEADALLPSSASRFACTLNPVTDAIAGAYASASEIGWAGNYQGVVTCLGGNFYVQDGFNKSFGFGIYAGGPTKWVDVDGYLPAQITTFHNLGVNVAITEFADQVTLAGNPYVVVYLRVAIRNPTNHVVAANPDPSPGLTPLDATPNSISPHSSAVHDYDLAVDRFGNLYPWPSSRALAAAGSFDRHFKHMSAFWKGQLAHIAEVRVPNKQLDNAYRSGFIYTQIARSGTHLDTGVNGYESEYSHDVVGILANLFTQGDFENAHALLLEARHVVGSQGEYADGIWTYSWPWAIYLLKTGDVSFVRANFSTPGPAGAAEPSIENTAHQIAAARTGPEGIIGLTDDIDSNGYWTVDDYEALMGLVAFRYIAQRIGAVGEARWATNEYDSLLASVNHILTRTVHRYHLKYLPCSMVEPNTSNRCTNPEDANWAAPFLFGRWAWDAQLFGVPVNGPGVQLINATYSYGFRRLRGKLPPDTFGGYPSDYYSTAYNAGYGGWGLASTRYRAQGILSYEFMISHTQSGPYSWWESASAPSTGSPWTGSHPAAGQGSSPHAWGIADANKVLLDSLVAEKTNGTLIVGRGVPDAWVAPGRTVSIANFPTMNGRRIGVTLTSRNQAITLTLSGSTPPGKVLFQLPLFVGNIATSSSGRIDQKTGTVQLSRHQKRVTVQLRD
jgi:hypothetical protein